MKKFNFLENLLRREFAMSGMSGMNGLRVDAFNPDSQPTVNRQSRLTSEQRHYSVTSARVAREWLNGSSRLRVDYDSLACRLRVLPSRGLRMAAMLCMLLTLSIGNAWGANVTWDQVAWGDITTSDVIIVTVTTSNGTYLLEHSQGTSATPKLGNTGTLANSNTNCTFSENDNVKWKKDANNRLCKASDGTKWLYTGTSNNAMRVGTSTSGNVWSLDGDYIKSNASTARYLSVYGTTDFRSYTSKQSGQVTRFYKAPSCTSITPTLSYTSTNLTIGGGNSSSPTLDKKGSTGAVTWSSDDEDVATVNSSGVVTPVGTGTCNITASIAAAGGKCAGEVSVEFTVKRTITYYIGSTSYTVGGIDGESLVSTLPANPSSCDDTNYPYFYGWKNGSISGSTTTAPTILASEVVNSSTAANTYYAVFTDTEAADYSTTHTSNVTLTTTGGTKATSAQVTISSTNYSAIKLGSNGASGNFIVAIPSGTTKLYLHALGWNGKSNKITLTTSLGTISPSSAQSLTAHSNVSGSGTTYDVTTRSNDFFEFTLASVNSAANVTITCSERCVVWGVNAASSSGGGTANYITTCCTSLGSINGSVTWSSVSSSSSTATLSWANNSNVNSYSVTCMASGASAGSVGSITGTTTKSCQITGLTPGTEYTFTINATGKSGYCDASQEIVAKAPKITAGSASGTSTYIAGSGPGSIQTFTVSGAGLTDNLTVTAPTNFLVSTDNGSSWSTSGGSKTITVSTPPSDLASTTVKFRLAADLSENSYGPSNITISGGDAASVTVAVSGTVSPDCENPTISSISSGATYRMNTTASAISVSASKNGTGPELTYQWYSNTANNTSTGSAIPSAISSTYTPPTTSAGTIYYYCVVSSGACSSTSSTVAITVSTPTITVSQTSRAFGTKKIGGSYEMTFTVSASNLSGSTGITVTKSGTNAAMFSIDASSPITQTSAGALSTKTITVTYSPTTAGAHSATLTFSSTGAADKTVSLSGTGQYEDLYKTALHTSVGALSDYVTGVTKAGTGYSVPVLSDVSKSGSECDGLHYHFAGWVEDTYKADPTGHVVAASGTKDASNKTFWAVWEQDGDGGNTLTKLGKSYTPATNDNIVIVAIDGSDAYALYQETYSTNYVKNWSFVNNVSNVSANAKNYVTLTSDGASGWYLGDATNGYIYTSSSNNLSVETGGNKTSFTIAWNDTEKKFTIVGSERWLSCRTDLTGDNDNKYRLGGLASGNPSGTAYFDLYKYVGAVYEDPVAECAAVTCATPTSATNTSVTAYGATIGWTGGGIGTLSKYEYAVWIDGESEPTSGYEDNGTNTKKDLTGLLSNTTYRWKVRKVCSGGAGESSWLRSSFTTLKVALTFSVPTGVSAVSGQDSDEELPDAEVPATCGDCWAFIGWTPAAYNGTTLPAKIFEDGEYAHLASGDGTTLYAVYGKAEYRLIEHVSEIDANEYYVLTFLDNDDVERAMANSLTSSIYASASDVSDNLRNYAGDWYLYNPSPSVIWKMTGTTSSGKLYNEAASVYLDISSTSNPILQASTSDNLKFTEDGSALFDIASTTETSYYLVMFMAPYWGVDDAHDSYSSCFIYKRNSSNYTTSPNCEEYDIAWKVEGETYSEGTPSTSATACDGIESLPDAPDDDALGCATLFMGWSENELTGTGNSAPADLFATSSNAPQVTADKTFHAVFATGNESDKESTSVTTTFTSKAWADDNSLWISGQDASAKEDRGVQVQTGTTGANATTKNNYSKVTSVVITYSTSNSGAGSVAVEVGGTAMTLSSGSISSKQSDQTLTYTPTSPATSLSGNVKFTVNCTTNSIYIKSVQIYYTKYNSYVNYVTYCTNEFTTAGNWNTAANWSLGTVPTIKERAVIKKAAVVNTTGAKARSVVIYNDGSSNTGSLEISAGQALVVAETVRKTTNGSTYTATGENDISFSSDKTNGLGALVMGTHDGTNKATVNFYSKSHGAKNSNESVNQFVGTPFNDETNVLYNWYNSWIYEFTNTSGTPSWKRIKDGDGMTPFHGYCIISADNEQNPGHMYWQQGTLVASEDQDLTLAYYNSETENMFANSWMAPIKISALNGNMDGTTGTVYIFNSGSAKDGDGSQTDGSAGNYSSYTPGTAGGNVIPAMQAFTVYASVAGSLSLDYSAYVYDPAVAGTTPVANKAPQRTGIADGEMEHLKLRVASESGWGDALDIYIREDFSDGFELYYDGPKIEGDDLAPLLYAVTDDGKMAINCVPDAEGTVVGFRRGEDAYYLFTFDYDGDEVLYLNDLKEQVSTPISADMSYQFYSAAGDMQARFIISRTPIRNTPTGVENTDVRNQKSDVRKLVIDDHVFIIRNGQMYDVTGKRVTEINK